MPPLPPLRRLRALLTPTSPPARILTSLTLATLWTHLLLAHVILVATASGPSMLPTLPARDVSLVVSRAHRRGRGVRVGDCVVYRIPGEGDTSAACKRVAGLGGDYVVRGLSPLADRLESVEEWEARTTTGDVEMMQVPEGHAWVLGDNLLGSRDSRVYGPVPLGLVLGKAVVRIEWSGPWGLVPRISRIGNGLEGAMS